MQKQISAKKTLALVCIAALVGAMISASIVIASTPVNPFVITSGVYPGAADYTVFADNGVYYAKSAFGSVVSESSTSAHTVINAVLASNMKIELKGILGLTGQILFNNVVNVELYGNAILTPDGTYKNATILVTPTAKNITIRDLSFDGRLNSRAGDGFFNMAVQVQGDNVLLENLRVQHYVAAGQIVFEHGAQFGRASHCVVSDALDGVLGVGFIAVNCSDIVFEGNTAYNLMQDGVDIYGSASRISVLNNNFFNNVGDGVHIEYFTTYGLGRCSNILIQGNMLTSNGYGGNGLFGDSAPASGGYAGVLVEGADHVLIKDNICSYNGRGIMVANYRSGLALPGSNYITIESNDVSASLFEGIHVKNGWFHKITDNTVTNNQQHGIFLNETSFDLVSRNQVEDNGQQTTNTYSGIITEGSCQSNTFSENQVYTQTATTQKYGIYMPDTATAYNVIIGCHADGMGTADLWINMTYNHVVACMNGTNFISALP